MGAAKIKSFLAELKAERYLVGQYLSGVLNLEDALKLLGVQLRDLVDYRQVVLLQDVHALVRVLLPPRSGRRRSPREASSERARSFTCGFTVVNFKTNSQATAKKKRR